ncbi:ADP-ribosylglycohydrolase family protein [Streptomyces sp. MZ04]|uniref:ADP-ribosylglycohydrolase family protein n=1 Tax=Streptomyces sp. MZ04 TaxID=2559236 RepID=UPI00107E6A54|nr:ADP-ribosylglycohydrolase family protein [Streptomyces sp. MZ04]TGB14035.1 ADP-ribosylglycohydrolase family protein [Streptomyces sp. MZ04]
MIRLTWVQPEDLLGHELRQAQEEGRDTSAVRARWLAAGGSLTPPRSGASPTPASPHLRALAEHLLAELTERPPPLWAGVPQGGTGGHNATHRPKALRHRLHAAWLGRAAGCLLGKPVEKLPLTGIRSLAKATGNWPLNTWFTAEGVPRDLKQAYPWNKRSATTSLAENIKGMPEDDDLNYPLLNLRLLQRHGKTFTTTDVARLWLDELPAARTFTAERIAYRNLLNGIEPPHTATHHNPFREWIGALIRADVHGWTNPGAPAKAAEQAHRDAALTHTANGVYGAMFAAATIAEAAAGTGDVHHCLRTGLTVVPPESRLARAVRHSIQLAREQSQFDHIVDELHTTYGHYHWVHVVPNAALLSAALTHAEGDFTGSITRAVSGGWDTDSNGATAGSIAGLLAGHPDALPDRWTSPLENRVASSVAGFDGIGFDTLADLTTELAQETNETNETNAIQETDLP